MQQIQETTDTCPKELILQTYWTGLQRNFGTEARHMATASPNEVVIYWCVHKISKCDCYHRYVCPSVRPHEQLGSQWTDFYEILYLSSFRKYISTKFKFH